MQSKTLFRCPRLLIVLHAKQRSLKDFAMSVMRALHSATSATLSCIAEDSVSATSSLKLYILAWWFKSETSHLVQRIRNQHLKLQLEATWISKGRLRSRLLSGLNDADANRYKYTQNYLDL